MSKWITRLLHISENDKISGRVFHTRMMISVCCIVLCMTAMLSSAYAWFMVSVSSEANVISGANYWLEIESVDGSDGDVITDSESRISTYSCELIYDDVYQFLLTATGTASQGYCEIIVADPSGELTTYYTSLIQQGESLEVCIQVAEGSTIEFLPIWGTYGAQAVYSLGRPTVFTIEHSTTPHVEYLVVEGVTLEELADYYGVLVEDICIYNDITELTVGDIIKIPGIADESIEPYQPPQIDVATPSNATPSNAAPSEATPSDATPSGVTSSDATPPETSSTDTTSSDATPPETSSTDTSLSDAMSSEDASTDAPSSDATPPEDTSTDTPSSDATPPEDTSSSTPPSDTPPSEPASSAAAVPTEEQTQDPTPTSATPTEAEQVDMTQESGAEESTAETATDAETAETLP